MRSLGTFGVVLSSLDWDENGAGTRSCSCVLAFVFGIGGLATLCFACWTSPWGNCHDNDGTCDTEPCARACRVCCLHFNPDNTSPGYLACIGTCSTLPFQCVEPEDPGDPQQP